MWRSREIQDLEKKNKELEEEKQSKIDKKENLLNNKEKFDKELKEKEEELAKYSKTLSEKELEIENKKQIVEKNIDSKYELIGNINTEKANFENLEKRGKTLKTEKEDTISELDKVRSEKEE